MSIAAGALPVLESTDPQDGTDSTAMTIQSGLFLDARVNAVPVGNVREIVSYRLRPIPCMTATFFYLGSKQYVTVGTGAPHTFQMILTDYRATERILAMMKHAFFTGPAKRVLMRPTNSHCVLNLKPLYFVDIQKLREYVQAHQHEDGIHLNMCARGRRWGGNILYLAMTQMNETANCLVSVVVSRWSVKVIGAKMPKLYIHFVRQYLCSTNTVLRKDTKTPCKDHRACFSPFDGYEYHYNTKELREHVRTHPPTEEQKASVRTRGKRSKMMVDEAILRASQYKVGTIT